MSQLNHLKRAVSILRDAFEDELREDKDWYYNLKHWTINIYDSDEVKSVIAYRVDQKLNLTDWSNYVIIEKSVCKWETIV